MTERVLILDDEALIAYDLADTVQSSGREVVGPAISLKEARQLFEERHPDVALLDINIRGETIWQLAGEMRAAGCRLIFCSANNAPSDRNDAFADCTFIPKPSAPERILQALEGLPTSA